MAGDAQHGARLEGGQREGRGLAIGSAVETDRGNVTRVVDGDDLGTLEDALGTHGEQYSLRLEAEVEHHGGLRAGQPSHAVRGREHERLSHEHATAGGQRRLVAEAFAGTEVRARRSEDHLVQRGRVEGDHVTRRRQANARYERDHRVESDPLAGDLEGLTAVVIAVDHRRRRPVDRPHAPRAEQHGPHESPSGGHLAARIARRRGAGTRTTRCDPAPRESLGTFSHPHFL